MRSLVTSLAANNSFKPNRFAGLLDSNDISPASWYVGSYPSHVGPIEFTYASGKCEPFDVAKHLTMSRLKEKLKT